MCEFSWKINIKLIHTCIQAKEQTPAYQVMPALPLAATSREDADSCCDL